MLSFIVWAVIGMACVVAMLMWISDDIEREDLENETARWLNDGRG